MTTRKPCCDSATARLTATEVTPFEQVRERRAQSDAEENRDAGTPEADADRPQELAVVPGAHERGPWIGQQHGYQRAHQEHQQDGADDREADLERDAPGAGRERSLWRGGSQRMVEGVGGGRDEPAPGPPRRGRRRSPPVDRFYFTPRGAGPGGAGGCPGPVQPRNTPPASAATTSPDSTATAPFTITCEIPTGERSGSS